MAYNIHYSDYSTGTGPPDPARWVGPPGPTGPQGPTGPTGPQGAPGTPYPDAPADGTTYGRNGAAATWTGVLPLSGGTVTGATTLNTILNVGTSNRDFSGATWTPQIYLNTGLYGTTTAGGLTNVHQVTINGDTLDASGSTGKLVNYLGLNGNFGGAAMKGNRQGVAASINLGAQSGNTPSGGQYVAIVGSATASAPDHGTGLTATTAGGGLWGANLYAYTTSGCTNFGQLIGMELNTAIGTGSTATQIIGCMVTPTGGHTVRGAFNNDTGYLLSSQQGAQGIDVGFACGSSLGVWPIRNDGAVLRAQLSFASTASARYGIDLSQASFPPFLGNVGGVFVSNGFAVDGLGAIQCGTTYLSPAADGARLDAKGSVGSTLPTIAAGGTGYGIGATLFDPYGGIYTVTAVGGGGAVTAITALTGPYGETHRPYYPTTTTPANPVPTTTWAYSTGASGCTLNLTWDTTRNHLVLNPSGGMTTMGGPTTALNVYPSGGNLFAQAVGGGLILDGVGSIIVGWSGTTAISMSASTTFAGTSTFSGVPTFNAGISCGAVVGATNTDLSKHITLHTAGYGVSVTANRVNVVAPPGAALNYTITGTGDIATVTSTGGLKLAQGLGLFNGTPVATKPAGWGAATGTATRTTFVTSSVTLPVLAEHVKALIDDLTLYGLIGP